MRTILSARRLAMVLVVAIGSVWPVSRTAAADRSEKWVETLSKIDALQADPLKPGAREDATAVVTWLTETKEVTAAVCADLTVELTNKDDSIGGTLAVHSILGAAKYAMTVPTEAQHNLDMYQASLEGLLNAYQKLVTADAGNRRKKIDKVLEARDAGRLREYVEKHARKCPR